MGNFVLKHFPDVRVKYKFKCRSDVKLGHLKQVLTEELLRVQRLKFTDDEIEYVKSQNIFTEEYPAFLKYLTLPGVYVGKDLDGQLVVEIDCFWRDGIYWEIFILCILNEIYFRSDEETRLKEWNNGEKLLLEKIAQLKKYPDLKFVDFGTRRAYSSDWHKRVVEIILSEIPNQLAGSSNVLIAKELGIKPIGTFAHEMTSCAATLFGDDWGQIRVSQNKIADMWFEMYGYDLSIFLSDTFGSDFTFKTFGEERLKLWKGFRQDSGDPFEFANKQIKLYEKYGIDSEEKWFVPSDGLTVPKMIDLHLQFKDRINVLPAIGTNLTNNLSLSKAPLSIVMKVVECNGKGTVKLSDNKNKFTGNKEDVERYIKIFDYTNDKSEETVY